MILIIKKIKKTTHKLTLAFTMHMGKTVCVQGLKKIPGMHIYTHMFCRSVQQTIIALSI